MHKAGCLLIFEITFFLVYVDVSVYKPRVWSRDANFPTIFIPWEFGELVISIFFLPQESEHLEPIPWGPGVILGELDPLKWAILSNEYDK